MRILHVIEAMDPEKGGVCKAVRTLAAGLEREGVYNEVVSLDAPKAKFIKNDPIIIHPLGPAKGPWRYSDKLIPWLRENVGDFDSIIVHGLWLYTDYALNKVIKTRKKTLLSQPGVQSVPKLFVMPHGMLDPYFQMAPGRKLKAIRNWLYWKLIENKVISNANALLFTCKVEMELARTTFKPYKPKEELVVGLGVQNPPKSHPSMREAFLSQCPELKNEPYLLFLSRIHEKKGVDLLLRAFALIGDKLSKDRNTKSKTDDNRLKADSCLAMKFKLVLAGPGLNTPFGKKIQVMIKSSDFLKSNVYLTDMLTGDAKWGAFYGCEAFILPSHQENFGIAVVEALACQKPVLISNQVNIWKEIETEACGLIEDDTIAGIEQLLLKWIALSINEKKDMSIQAGNTYKKYFAVEPVVTCLYKAMT